MSSNFNLSANSSNNYNYRQAQASQLKKVEAQSATSAEQIASGNNPFNIDNLFSFKKPDIVYNKVMKSTEMLGMLKAKRVANKFMELTAPEYEVGKKLDFDA